MVRVIQAGGAPLAQVHSGVDSPLIAFALHSGHSVRPGLEAHLRLGEDERLREEDPFTTLMAPCDMRLVEVLRSRFEVDLNRPRERAVYVGPSDAWGLSVWNGAFPEAQKRISLSTYDAFYDETRCELERLQTAHGRFVVLDLHSYNHRRDGADRLPADAAANPEVNLGTRHIDRDRWAPVVDAFMESLGQHGLDVRENVKFGGGHLAQWVAQMFPEVGCPLAIEFKKTFMDEWTGEPDFARITSLRGALSAAAVAVEDALSALR